MEPIDIVYLWCDDADPDWRAKRLACAKRIGRELSAADGDAVRFLTNDDLRYALRSLEVCAPWIRKVHLLVDDDATLPSWLDTGHPKLNVARHRAVLPSSALPCFNPYAIELYLHAIPGLAERFLYANDDMMFYRPVPPDFFFAADGYPICRYTLTRIPDREGTNYRRAVLNAENLLASRFCVRGVYAKAFRHWPHHNVDAYLKSDFAACFRLFAEDLRRTTHTPFRTDDNCERTLFMGHALCVGRGHLRYARRGSSLSRPWYKRLLRPGYADSLVFQDGKWRQASAYLEKFKPGLFCVNDTDGGYSEEKSEQLQEFYRSLFPKPSSFELGGH